MIYYRSSFDNYIIKEANKGIYITKQKKNNEEYLAVDLLSMFGSYSQVRRDRLRLRSVKSEHSERCRNERE